MFMADRCLNSFVFFPFSGHKSFLAVDDLGLTLLRRFHDNRGTKKRGSQTEESYAPTHGRMERTAGRGKRNRTSTFLFSLSPHRPFPSTEKPTSQLTLKESKICPKYVLSASQTLIYKTFFF